MKGGKNADCDTFSGIGSIGGTTPFELDGNTGDKRIVSTEQTHATWKLPQL
jgi:hypothetical protein